jgi:hypothetical protein
VALGWGEFSIFIAVTFPETATLLFSKKKKRTLLTPKKSTEVLLKVLDS